MGAGRPPIYSNADDLQAKVDEYFLTGREVKEVVIGPPNNRELAEIPICTVSGLAYFLGFESRQSFYDYEEREEFSYIIKRARLFIEQEYESALRTGGNPTGAIFALKNMGWRDKTEQDITSGGEKITGYTIEVLNETQNSNK